MIDKIKNRLKELSVDNARQQIDESFSIKDANEMLKKALMGYHRDMNQFVHVDFPELIKELRARRQVVNTETSLLMKSLEDVRAFFVCDDHKLEVARLREFVELVEKLQSLKRDGTLDAISDTIIRLSCKRESTD